MSLADEVAAVPYWWHSIDLGNGVVTPGEKRPEDLAYEWWLIHADLNDKTVLDIGAWDGWFSFAAERAGAKRVVALDHFMWAIDAMEHRAYKEDCRRRGDPFAPVETLDLWHPDSLPGKRGFDLAHRVLKSNVEPVIADFMTMDLDALGTFDVVLYLGVLYHMRHPLLALERVREVTREVAYIETQTIVIPGRPDWAACEFFETDELNTDPTNWWAPTMPALQAMCRASGFSDIRVLSPEIPPSDEVIRYGGMVRAS